MPSVVRSIQRLGPSSQSRYARGRDRTGRRGNRPMRRRELLLTATAMMAAPGGLRAHQKAMPVIGLLGSTSTGANVLAFRQGLHAPVLPGDTRLPGSHEPGASPKGAIARAF